MGAFILEYNSEDGYRCQRCGDWTLGGGLYSGTDRKRVCFLCYMDDRNKEFTARFGTFLKERG